MIQLRQRYRGCFTVDSQSEQKINMRYEMKKGEIYEGIIEKVDFPNKGYVLVEDFRDRKYVL